MAVTRDSGQPLSTWQRGRLPGDGVNLAYTSWAGAGRPLVALHGITASSMSFVGIAEKLAGRRPLLALDLRGRGDSDKPTGPYGFAQHAQDVIAALRELGSRPVVLVGHSMGAYVAIAVAAAEPRLVAGLLLLDGGLPLTVPTDIPPEQLLDQLLAPQLARLRSSYASRAEYYAFWRGIGAFPADEWSSWVEAYLDYDLGGAPPALRPKAAETAVRADFRDTLNADKLRARIRQVRAPMHLLRAPAGFLPDQPPLLATDAVETERASVPLLTDRLVAGTTHYTLALGAHGASAVADSAVELAVSVGA